MRDVEGRSHHVLTKAWSCDCAVFTLAAFGGFSDGEGGRWRYAIDQKVRVDGKGEGEEGFVWGGAARSGRAFVGVVAALRACKPDR